LVLAALAVSACASGCALYGYSSPVIPPPGFVYSHYKVPLTIDKASGDLRPDDKMGSCHTRFLWIPPFRPITLAWAEAAVKKAAAEGKISRIKHVDYEFLGVLFVYGEYKVIVYGD
jgi:hypothetical protein